MSKHDFDFLIGDWNVKHHRLKERLNNCQEWEVAEATDSVRPIIFGNGNIGSFRREFDGEAYEGIPLRIYNPSTKLWSIYWIDSIGNRLDPPVLGSFSNGKGLFYGDDVCNGKLVRVRFIWSEITATSAIWEQAFSLDNGGNWEVNSIMYFTRQEQGS